MISPIVQDYVTLLRRIDRAKTTETRRRNIHRAKLTLSIMTAKAADQATEAVRLNKLEHVERQLF